MITEDEYLNALDLIRRYRLQQSKVITRETSIYECSSDVRVLNILSQAASDCGIAADANGNIKLGEFEGFTRRDFAMYRGAGVVTLYAIEKIFLEAEMEFKKIKLNPEKKKKKIRVQPFLKRSQVLN